MTQTPLCIDLYAGLGGWTEGFLAEGWRVVGFDIERHIYGEHHYPAQLVIQDVRTIHGKQFRDADMIVASSPCQEFSYRAMPWKRAKALGPPVLGMELFAQAARIQREACEAAGRYIPMIQENVKGAQPWVGRAAWHFGSYYLWGDVPALMPIVARRQAMKTGDTNAFRAGAPYSPHFTNPTEGVKVGGLNWSDRSVKGQAFNTIQRTRELAEERATKGEGGSWFNVAHNTTSGHGQNPDGRLADEGVKQRGSGREWFAGEGTIGRTTGSKSAARRAASARIAKIPETLARYIAHAFHPGRDGRRTA